MELGDEDEGDTADVIGVAAEHRVKLLQSEITVRDQIATLKQRLDVQFQKLEQQALSDTRALRGQEMLTIRKREARILTRGCEKRQEPDKLGKVLTFEPSPTLIWLEKELAELGSVKLVDDEEDDTAEIQPAQSFESILSQDTYTSDFVQIGAHVRRKKSEQISISSSFCFVQTGTLSRRLKRRSSLLNRSEILKATEAIDKVSESPTQAKRMKMTDTVDDERKADNILFTVLMDNKIVTVSKSDGTVRLYRPDFVLLSTAKVTTPSAICHHVAYDVIAIASREGDKEFVVLLKTSNNELDIIDKLLVNCQTHVSCMTYSSSKLYIGCNGNHIHVIDENWEEKQKLSYAPIGQKLVSMATNDAVFSLVGSDGSVTYVDSMGRYLSKDSINAICVGFVSGKPFVLCNDNGIKVVETSPTEEEVTEPTILIKTGLRDALDMHISADEEEVSILYWGECNLDITKFKLIH